MPEHTMTDTVDMVRTVDMADRPTAGGDTDRPGGAPAPAGARQAPAFPPVRGRRAAGDAGMATAEYAIATLAACGFAGLLVLILKGGQVRGLLMAVIERALSIG